MHNKLVITWGLALLALALWYLSTSNTKALETCQQAGYSAETCFYNLR